MSSWQRYDVLMQLERIGLLPTVHAAATEIYQQIAASLLAGGLPIIEVLLRTPEQQIPRVHLDAIYELRKTFGQNLLVGAGTVQTPERAQSAIDAGAQFLVSNLTDPDIIRLANINGILMIPGAREDSQILTAISWGCPVVKLFAPLPDQASDVNLAHLKEFFNIFPQTRFTITSGITPDKVGAYLQAGVPFVVPSGLITSEIIESKSWKLLTTRTQEYLQAVASARAK